MDWIIESVTQFLLSPLWTAPVARFIDEECIHFHHTEEHSAFEGDSHQRFVRLVDALVTSFVEELGVSHDDFEAAMQTRPGCAQPVVEQLTAADNFDTFKTTMLARKHQLHGDWLGGSEDEELDEELDAELLFALEASRLEAAEQADALEAQELADLQAATTASHFEAARSAAGVAGGAEAGETGGTCNAYTGRALVQATSEAASVVPVSEDAEAAAAGDARRKKEKKENKEKKRRRREIDEVRYPAKPLETSWQNAPQVSEAVAARSSTPPVQETAAADADAAAAEAAERLRRAQIRELHRKKQAEERERKRQAELDEARAEMEKKKKDSKTLAEGERLKRELQGVAASSGEGGDADASAAAAATNKGDAALGDALAALGV